MCYIFFSFIFKVFFCLTHSHVLFWGHWYPCFGFLVTFQSQSGFCLIRIAEANVMYISWDPPLMLHVADLLTDSIAGVDRVHILPKDITVWQQWVLKPWSTDHECCALTIWPRVPVIYRVYLHLTQSQKVLLLHNRMLSVGRRTFPPPEHPVPEEDAREEEETSSKWAFHPFHQKRAAH